MQFRRLGRTGIHVSAIAFGAGPVPALMTDDSLRERQLLTVQSAIEAGVNWFDTAATYGEGRSEKNLGAVLQELGIGDDVHIATKVRLPEEQLHDIRGYVFRSVEQSLQRLKRQRITLLQLHNSITPNRGDLPTSVTPADVLDAGGVLEAMRMLQAAGVVRHIGLTGLGDPSALLKVIDSGEFDTVQTPYNLLNPSAGQVMPADFADTNYANQFGTCARHDMGVFAIRVFAGGAILGHPPSEHTKKTPFFPMDLFLQDRKRAEEIRTRLGQQTTMGELALRFVLSHGNVSAALIGLSNPAQVAELKGFVSGPTSLVPPSVPQSDPGSS